MNWDAFVKTYDVRGLVGTQLTDEIVECFGAAFADELELQGQSFVIGHDMRDSSPGFAKAFALGANKRGANALMLGLCSTDMTYFASGKLELPAVMFTASHNPASYNGIKFSRANARGISLQTGLAAIRNRAIEFQRTGIDLKPLGSTESINLLSEYATYMRQLVDLSNIKKLKVVIDTANGMGGFTVPAVLSDAAGLPKLPIEIIPMYFELDGTFPNHEANPLDVKNLVDLQKAVLEHKADLGLAFDGDADRCFVVDELGRPVTPSAIAAIVAKQEIKKVRKQHPAAQPSVIHNALTSRFVPEAIVEAGGLPVRTRVGHSLIKDAMAQTGAIFGGEHSAHYYFQEFWGADNGMLAAMQVLLELGSGPGSMSELADQHNPYFQSGEINSQISDPEAAVARIRSTFPEASVEAFDGHTFSGASGSNWWWLNVRPSNTEPLLRLNVESNDESVMKKITELAIQAIRQS